MTVQELINVLSQIKDQELEVLIETTNGNVWYSTQTEIGRIEDEIVESGRKAIILATE